ncbi:hypothetical protein ACE193_15265 [Bernardetia sp. OM2101]|uniref:hypothetical protein n=1 Tax=Bernardetia sp. OM2101 TaxID=3344876 RepID=UPI0035D0F9BB
MNQYLIEEIEASAERYLNQDIRLISEPPPTIEEVKAKVDYYRNFVFDPVNNFVESFAYVFSVHAYFSFKEPSKKPTIHKHNAIGVFYYIIKNADRLEILKNKGDFKKLHISLIEEFNNHFFINKGILFPLEYYEATVGTDCLAFKGENNLYIDFIR